MISRIVFATILFACALLAQPPVEASEPVEASQSATSAVAGLQDKSALSSATLDLKQKLEASLEELNALRETVAKERIPLNERLSALENQLIERRRTVQGLNNARTTDAFQTSELAKKKEQREREVAQILAFFAEFRRTFETRLHPTEAPIYVPKLEAAGAAAENAALTREARLIAQIEVVSLALERLEKSLGGASYSGRAKHTADGGTIKEGTIRRMGPWAMFAGPGQALGFLRRPLNDSQAEIVGWSDPMNQAAGETFIATGGGAFPFDPTLGNAARFEETEETLLEHIQKGGIWMYPILGIGALALLVALIKFGALMGIRNPSAKQLRALMEALGDPDRESVLRRARKLPGPTGAMLRAAVAQLGESRELIEEVMYERVLRTKLRTTSLLPFVAVTAASAPLLGLLGTVTGIIETFKVITAQGTSDVQSLSGGISAALITTEYGLIVAIPTLILHSFLSRMGRSIIARMEATAVQFLNEAQKAGAVADSASSEVLADPVVLREQINQIMAEFLAPVGAAAGSEGAVIRPVGSSTTTATWTAEGRTSLDEDPEPEAPRRSH